MPASFGCRVVSIHVGMYSTPKHLKHGLDLLNFGTSFLDVLTGACVRLLSTPVEVGAGVRSILFLVG